jgi:hypothetical protein
MKKVVVLILAGFVAYGSVWAQNEETTAMEKSPLSGLSLGAAVTLSDVADEVIPGIRGDLTFDKTLEGLHLYGNIYDKVLINDSTDIMRVSHFEEEIGCRFGISQTVGIGVFANNVNNIQTMAMTMPTSPPAQMTSTYLEGLVEPGLKFDGFFPFGMIQATVGIPVLYRQSGGAPDADPLAGFHPEISWQSNFGLGISGGVSFGFPPGDNEELTANEKLLERTELNITYMTGPFFVGLSLYTNLDFTKVNITPMITYFTGPVSVWFSLEMGKINLNYTGEFGVCPTAGVTYSF